MTEKETRLRDCLIRTAKMICHWTGDPIPPLWRSVLTDIYETLRDASVAVLENRPYPPDTLTGVVSRDVHAQAALRVAVEEAQMVHDLAQAAQNRAAENMRADNGAAEPPTVLVGVYGGVVQWVQKSDDKIRVIVRDYDCDGRDEGECGLQRDAEGNLYTQWEE